MHLFRPSNDEISIPQTQGGPPLYYNFNADIVNSYLSAEIGSNLGSLLFCWKSIKRRIKPKKLFRMCRVPVVDSFRTLSIEKERP